jgi:hypothetical protein
MLRARITKVWGRTSTIFHCISPIHGLGDVSVTMASLKKILHVQKSPVGCVCDATTATEFTAMQPKELRWWSAQAQIPASKPCGQMTNIEHLAPGYGMHEGPLWRNCFRNSEKHVSKVGRTVEMI